MAIRPRMRTPWLQYAYLVMILVCAGCTSIGGPSGLVRTPIDPASRQASCPPGRPVDAIAPPANPRFAHVLIVVLENQNYGDVHGDLFFGAPAKQGATFTDFHGLFHPSYSNYLAMVAGNEIRTHFDLRIDVHERTIADLLKSRGLTCKNYAEGYPEQLDQYSHHCFTGDRLNRYVRKHVPFMSFIPIQQYECHNIVPASQFATDVMNNRLPTYALYSPDLDHDGHNPRNDSKQGLANASTWLKSFWALYGHHLNLKDTLVVVTFDESHSDTHDMKNHIYTVFLGDVVRAGEYHGHYNHYNVLRTIEENFGLGTLADGDGCAKPIGDIWKK